MNNEQETELQKLRIVNEQLESALMNAGTELNTVRRRAKFIIESLLSSDRQIDLAETRQAAQMFLDELKK